MGVAALSCVLHFLPRVTMIAMSKTRIRRRSRNGSQMAEMPAALWLLVVGFLIPLIGLASYGYRAILFYFGVRDACYTAARARSYTNGYNAAILPTTGRLYTIAQAWTGISVVSGSPHLFIIEHPLVPGPDVVKSDNAPMPVNPGPDIQNNIYFLRLAAVGSIEPLLRTNWVLFGMTIPGLNAPYELKMGYQVYVENPQGLTQ